MLNHASIEGYILTNFQLVQHHKYNFGDLENMIPWERQLYIDMLNDYIKRENERLEQERRK